MKRVKRKQQRGTLVIRGAHLWRLLKAAVTPRPRRSEAARRLVLVEHLIGKHSGPKVKRGPHKGHSETDTAAWIAELTQSVLDENAAWNKGRAYDGNMAAAARLGLILVAWYAHVHRAKSFDPNRPLRARRAAAMQRIRYLVELQAILVDDSVMGEVWGQGQRWNFPFGKGARGGKFV